MEELPCLLLGKVQERIHAPLFSLIGMQVKPCEIPHMDVGGLRRVHVAFVAYYPGPADL